MNQQNTTRIEDLLEARQRARVEQLQRDAEFESRIVELNEIRSPLHRLVEKRRKFRQQIVAAKHMLRRHGQYLAELKQMLSDSIVAAASGDCSKGDELTAAVDWNQIVAVRRLYTPLIVDGLNSFIKEREDALPGIEAEMKAYATDHGLTHELPPELGGPSTATRPAPAGTSPAQPSPAVPSPARGRAKSYLE